MMLEAGGVMLEVTFRREKSRKIAVSRVQSCQFLVLSKMECFGKFSYDDIFHYLREASYPGDFTKSEKGSLRKISKYFLVKGADLFYKSKSTGKIVMYSYSFPPLN